MTLYQAPYLVSQFGMPLYGISGMPPFTGNYYWVNATTGNDGNTGGPQDPFATLTQALAMCTAGNNDVVFVTGTIHLSATLHWSKANTHLVGLCSPLRRGKRARISNLSATATPFTPLVDFNGGQCWVKNIQTFYGFSSSATNNTVANSITSTHNVFDNVEFLGFGDATVSTGTAVQTGARALVIGTASTLGSGDENSFYHCVFGADTEARNATNYTLEFAAGSGSARNYFEDCDFEALLGSSGTAAAHLLTGANSVDRYTNFVHCRFHNSANSGGSTMAQLAVLNASQGGDFLFDQSPFTSPGITALETTPTNQVYVNGPVNTSTTSCKAIYN